MIAHHFVKWCETANTVERCSGVALLAEAVTQRKFLAKETREAEAALLFALEDPSPHVRRTIAGIVATSDRAPRPLVIGLARDIDEVALPVVAGSPLLQGSDLVDLVREGSRAVRIAAARRSDVPEEVCNAILASAEDDACFELAANGALHLSASLARRMAEAYQGDGRVRNALLKRDDLPADVRHALLQTLADDLGTSPFVAGVLGPDRAARLRADLSDRATAAVMEAVPDEEATDFMEHLRTSGALTTAILLKAVCAGRIDIFAVALARLAHVPEKRVRAIVAEARQPAFAALANSAGLPPMVVPLFLAGIRVWKDACRIEDIDSPEVTASVIQRILGYQRRTDGGNRDLVEILERFAKDAQRSSTRMRMERYLAA